MQLSVGMAGYGARVAELTVLYDEGCGFCTEIAARLQRLDGIAATPIGSAGGGFLLRDLDERERYAELHVVDRLGRRSSGGAALPLLARRLRGGSVLATLLAAFPRLTSQGYAFAARHRALLAFLSGIRC
jgi:predicted DCC family thiol-disulfide oxidoreductase YuxK